MKIRGERFSPLIEGKAFTEYQIEWDDSWAKTNLQ